MMTQFTPFQRILSLVLMLFAIAWYEGSVMSLMDIDACQYASISKEMFFNKSYLQVYDRGADYLDKPPMLFWLSVLSFHIFGISDWAYRIPSILVSLAGIYALYRFCKLWYTEEIALTAALVMASCQACFMMHHDIRTDSLLTGFTMLAFWQMAHFDKKGGIIHLLLAVVAVGCAMMSKGPIGLIIPLVAFGMHYLLSRNFQLILRWQYLPALVLLVIILLPMSIGLYQQFDLHPEKEAYGLKGPSGLRFYYWTQSFGRITGESAWSNDPDPFFLVHSFLWSFLPWSLLFILAFFWNLKQTFLSFKNKVVGAEFITISGFVLIFLLLSRSSYQLPHYTFVIHPLAAILLAKYLHSLQKERTLKTLSWLMIFTILCVFAVIVLVAYTYLPEHKWLSLIIISMGSLVSVGTLFMKQIKPAARLVFAGALVLGSANIVLNGITYPQLFPYQSDEQVGRFMNTTPEGSTLLAYNTFYWYSCDFYCNRPIATAKDSSDLIAKIEHNKCYVLTDSVGLNQLTAAGLNRSQKVFWDFPISNLSPDFLNPATRQKQLTPLFLIQTF